MGFPKQKPTLSGLASQLAGLDPDDRATLAGLLNGTEPIAPVKVKTPAPIVPEADLPGVGSTLSATVVSAVSTLEGKGYCAIGKGRGFVFRIYAMPDGSSQARKALRG